MAWHVDIKGYFCRENKTFVAIAPVFDVEFVGKDRPINHVKLEGVVCSATDYDSLEMKEWHPDNPFSEKWIEIHPHLCKWEIKESEFNLEVNLLERTQCGVDGDRVVWRFFVPAEQLAPLHWTQRPYRSQERFAENYGAGVKSA